MFVSTDIPFQSASGSIDNVCIYRHTLPVCKWKHLECLYLQIYPPSLQAEASIMFDKKSDKNSEPKDMLVSQLGMIAGGTGKLFQLKQSSLKITTSAKWPA